MSRFQKSFKQAAYGLEEHANPIQVARTEEDLLSTDVADIAEEDLNVTVQTDGDVEVEGTGSSVVEIEAELTHEEVGVVHDAAIARVDAVQAAENVDAVEQALESLRDVRRVVKHYQKNGRGLESHTVALLNTACTVHAERLGIPAFGLAIASTENEGEGGTQIVDDSQVAEVEGRLEEALPAVKEEAERAAVAADEAEAAIPEAISSVREEVLEDAVAVEPVEGEDVPGTDDSIAPEVVIEGQISAAVDSEVTSDAIDELAVEREATTEVREVVEKANEEGGLALESLAALSVAMTAINGHWENREMDLTPGVEDYEEGKRYVVSVERIINNEEEKSGKLKELAKSYLSDLKRTYDYRGHRYVFLRDVTGQLIASAQARANAKIPENMRVETSSKNLHKQGKIPASSSDMTQFLNDFFKVSTTYQATFSKDAARAFDRTMALLPNNFRKGMSREEVIAGLKTVASSIQDPRDSLAKLSKVQPGGRVWMVNRPANAKGTIGSHASYGRLAHLAYDNIPVFSPFNKDKAFADPKQSLPLLSPKQVGEIASQMMVALNSYNWRNGLRELGAAFNLVLLVKYFIWRRRLGRASSFLGYQSDEEAQAIAALREILKIQSNMRFNMPMDAVAEVARVGWAFYRYGNKCLRVASSAGIESVDDSAKGAELKTGAVVKCGKSMVKITKRHTKDFEFEGKTYKASVSKPMYVVQDLKSKKRSVRKAAALG